MFVARRHVHIRLNGHMQAHTTRKDNMEPRGKGYAVHKVLTCISAVEVTSLRDILVYGLLKPLPPQGLEVKHIDV